MKLLAYADDLLVFLSHPPEWAVLLAHLQVYSHAVNGKINLQKTQVFSLTGGLIWVLARAG